MRFLKPFIALILLTVILLFGQAMADLALPDYMSRIVNNGIQQSGIEYVVPEIMIEDDFQHLMLFMTPEEMDDVEEIYSRVAPEDNNYKDYDLKADGKAIYVLDEDAKYSLSEIEPAMAKSILAFTGISKMIENAEEQGIEIDGIMVPLDADVFEVLARMPLEKRLDLAAIFIGQMPETNRSMLIQAGARALVEYNDSIGIDVAGKQRGYILGIGAIMIAITALGAAASISVGFLASRIAAGVGRNLRRGIFTKIESFSNQEFDKFSTASLITRSTNDVTQIQSLLVMLLRIIFYAPIMGIGGVFKALEKSSSMSWIIALAVIVLIGMIAVIFSIALPKFKLVQKLIDRLNMVTRENLSGMMVIRAFNTQAFEENRFDEANTELTATNLFVNRLMVFFQPAMMLIMNGTSLLIVWVGAHQIANAAMKVGDMMAYMQYALQIIFAFLMLSMMFIMVPRAIVSAQRISEVLDVEPAILDPKNPVKPNAKGAGEVVYENVEFRFPGAEESLLKNISFVAKPGETTAIIGATGSGKTTLVNLLPRFYDVSKGEIKIDGVNISDMTMHDLRDMIGYVPQKASLFSGTIESNLKYAKDVASADEVSEAVSIAQASDIVSEKADGLKSEVSQHGANLSGGQKQRLSIARALVKRPKIYIIDDSFSALDFKTDSELRKALKDKIGGSTILLIAQRVSTIKNADRIVVLEEGGICGIGKHEELMKKCEIYKEIALSQLSAEELS
jgi:ATP-binding cassette subfamily B protein